MLIDYKQLEYLHPKLRQLLEWLEFETGVHFVNTSNYRIGDNGVHGTLPCRGWDLRCRNRKLGQCVVDLVNEYWVYDPSRPALLCAIAHGQGSNYHIHLQVTDKTIESRVDRPNA